MRSVIVLGGILIGAAASPGAAQTPHPGLGPYPAKVEYTLDNKLAGVITKADDGQQYFLAPRDEWYTTATAVQLKAKKSALFSTQQFVEDGRAYTLLTTGSTALLWERDVSETSPTIQILPGKAVVTPAVTDPPTCGGCLIAGQRFIDLEERECSLICPGCSCMHCWTQPCPIPQPPEPPVPDPCDDFWEMWEECMEDNIYDDSSWGLFELYARP